MGSPAYRDELYDEHGNEMRTELIDGKLTMMSPGPSVNHWRISFSIVSILSRYLKGKKCEALGDGIDLYLSDGNRYVPDAMVVCDPKKIKSKGVYGAPDLVVEVLSRSSARRDYGKKMDAYEKAGVKEYWIADQYNKSINTYVLRDGVLELDASYQLYTREQLAKMDEEERAEVKTEIKCSLFDDLTIKLEDIFELVK